MTRLEALKWCWENIANPDNKFLREEVEDTIGSVYFNELRHMDFIFQWYEWKTNCTRVQLTALGKSYCEEMFG